MCNQLWQPPRPTGSYKILFWSRLIKKPPTLHENHLRGVKGRQRGKSERGKDRGGETERVVEG